VTGSDRDEEGRLIAGRYRLQRRIGGGAMGVVYLAKDEMLDRTVAVKELLLTPGLSEEEAEHARKRSFREARIAARLQHQYAITVFSVAEDDGKPVLVMEYLPSQSLAEVLAERKTLPPAEAAKLGAHAASALAAAHAAGIVHRDVKPGNILISEDGAAKITDFGISRATDDGTLTGSGRFAGTPAFLAPEAARGEKPSQASDVFSLGATLYAAVEGRFPYGSTENQMALLYAAAAGRINPPEPAGPLTDVLNRMMLLDPDARPSMAELADELAKLAEPPEKRGKNARRLLVAGLAVLVVAAGVLAYVLIPRSPGDNTATGGSPQPPVPGNSSSAEQPAAVAPTTTTAPPTTTTTPPPALPPATGTVISQTQAVSDYYAVLPTGYEQAWTMLGPVIQREVGKASFVSWWTAITNLRVTVPPQMEGENKVQVTIEFTKGGKHWRETHHLGMIAGKDRPLINTDYGPSSFTIG
jgi:eukaryotic-like serine/threonine-protein kinase